MLNSDDEGILGADTEILGKNLFIYCTNVPINNSDPNGFWKLSNKWKIRITVGILALAAGVLIASGAGAPVGCLLLGVAQGAIAGATIGAATGAATGAAMGAVGHRISTGSWRGAGRAALRDANQGMIDGAFSGAITGAITGGLTSRACFVAGTSILTSSGLVAIETIKAGDLVFSENPETGENSLKPVVQAFEKEVNKLIHVYVDGEEIKTTDEHPFWVVDKGWVGASHLLKGDKVKLQNDEIVAVANVTVEYLAIPVKVYNFEVKDFHTYYVSDSSILVHNMCATRKTTAHGAYRIAGRNFSQREIDLLYATKDIRKQADGARVFVRTINQNNYSILVEGEGGIVTAMKNLTKRELNKLAKNNGWYR